MAEGTPPSPTFSLRFGGAEEAEAGPLLREARDEAARSQMRLALLEAVDGRRGELGAWLAADPSNPELLLVDPGRGTAPCGAGCGGARSRARGAGAAYPAR